MSPGKTNAISVPQDKEAAVALLAEYGATLRELDRLELDMNDKIAALKLEAAVEAEPHRVKVEQMERALQAYCEAHRKELTKDGRVKTADLDVGKVSWRWNPAKVTIRGKEETVLELLKRSESEELKKFLRPTVEIDRVEMLRNPKLAETVEGVEITKGVETFEIKPDSAKVPETSESAA
ncbi:MULTISPECIES: host-nuclease inhibitor Gam family protein [unclassified Bradyrhizobium]|uniref:host-nuclease inhibitor Gam family protein n=1 Tax=unclassified Bradyrhizobium TaxID=2631580 RepID=UPI00211DDDA1|nr:MULTISPECIES: host-nuclease inhibitor Gam family protein [unclassified Bradyrhizobium]MDD1534590.1 host-nuclease inhibitor protein Gam [Bradyrhizobium sp. WBOS8]MDD1581454.1 host-nuclease inhibitor protein Gam [Bradyrhizobium sp. WBOS4]UUO49740.1 host-nuclease inhibitor protein Gam [Bradyrhizobium sp. WBOS04]UUO58506.1 host-nuclease inhibitor protein Gam [Bradyrhizobium sp. WBOS08]